MRGLGRGYRSAPPVVTLDAGQTGAAGVASGAATLHRLGVPVLEAAPLSPGLAGRPFMLGLVGGARVELLCQLSDVSLEACVGVTDVVVIMLARNSEGALRKLNLAHCADITAASTTAIAMFCPQLEELNLAGCVSILSPIVDAKIAATLVVQTGRDRSAGLVPDAATTWGVGWGIGRRLRELEKEGPRLSVPPPWDLNDDDVKSSAGLRKGVPAHVHYDASPAPRPKWLTLKLLDVTGLIGLFVLPPLHARLPFLE